MSLFFCTYDFYHLPWDDVHENKKCFSSPNSLEVYFRQSIIVASTLVSDPMRGHAQSRKMLSVQVKPATEPTCLNRNLI
jgi:hypothetical protein